MNAPVPPAAWPNLASLATPCAVVDERKLQHNIDRMQRRMNDLRVAFRPHVKTTKCQVIAQRQVTAGATGITVSTLKEAEQFHEAGFDDILLGVCISPDRLPRALALRRRGCKLSLVLDSLAAAEAVVALGRTERHRFDVLIEIDTDGHRSGVEPHDDLLIAIGETLHHGNVAVQGVMTHAGSSYGLSDRASLEALADQERSLAVLAAQRLRAAHLPCPVVSVGSTPTALTATHLDGVTEVRAGVYVLFDLVMAGVGVCTTEEIALSVATTVIGHQATKGWTIVDAGWMALSRDRGTQRQAIDQGYGVVCTEDGKPLHDLLVIDANQEHGILGRRGGVGDSSDPRLELPIGTRLRILPNHACATGAQYDDYALLTAQGSTVQLPRFRGW